MPEPQTIAVAAPSNGRPSLPPRRARVPAPAAFTLAAFVALLIALTLQFAAAAKLLGPNPKEVFISPGTYHWLPDGLLLDHAVAACELLVVVLLLTLRRRWWSWPPVVLMFSLFAGFAYCAYLRNIPCGCFAKLWTPPAKVTASIDLGFVVLALATALALRARWWAIVAVAVLAPLVGYGGFKFADTHLPPPPTTAPGKTAVDRLMASDLMADVTSQTAGGPQWYVFVYDPMCSVCESMKPVVEMFQKQYDDAKDTTLRIRELSIPDLVEKLGIADSEWAPTPTVLLVKDGKVVRKWNGEEVPLPDQEFQMKAASGQYAAGL